MREIDGEDSLQITPQACPFARSATSFICAARGGNDVSLRLNDVACDTQMMLCLAAQMKKSKSYDLDFLYKGYEKDIFRGLPQGFELKENIEISTENLN